MKAFKKILVLLSFFVFISACSSKTSKEKDHNIHVVSREEGSGTRGAFVELLKIEKKDSSGKKVDHTLQEAIITNSTAVMLTTVSGDENAIGYVSLGSLNNSVKTLKVDEANASVEDIKSGKYKIARPFNVVTKDKISQASEDFLNFILSKDGQEIVAKAGYITIDSQKTYQKIVSEGKVNVSGSSSITPLMEKLKEAYQLVNSGIKVEVQQSDSSTGVANVVDGTSDIGMASRKIKDSEKEKGVLDKVIAIDGIAIIVNKNNPVNNLSSQQINQIFVGEINSWSEFSDK